MGRPRRNRCLYKPKMQIVGIAFYLPWHRALCHLLDGCLKMWNLMLVSHGRSQGHSTHAPHHTKKRKQQTTLGKTIARPPTYIVEAL
eukprot:4889520-Amphidinium_carterae.1